MSLVVFTALAGLLLAPRPRASGDRLHLAAGDRGRRRRLGRAEHVVRRRHRQLMARTATRPDPCGRMAGGEALAFGLVLSAFAVLTLGLAANWLAAGLLAFTIFYYVVVYTMWLKRSTPQNIVIGGAAGRLAADGRLCRRHRLDQPVEPRALRHHLHLDAAAFLVAGPGQIRRLRPRRRAHGAQCLGSGRDAARRSCSIPLVLAPIGVAALVARLRRPGLWRRLCSSAAWA